MPQCLLMTKADIATCVEFAAFEPRRLALLRALVDFHLSNRRNPSGSTLRCGLMELSCLGPGGSFARGTRPETIGSNLGG